MTASCAKYIASSCMCASVQHVLLPVTLSEISSYGGLMLHSGDTLRIRRFLVSSERRGGEESRADQLT